MTKAIRLRRAILATLILTAVLTGSSAATATATTIEQTRTANVSTKVCPVEWRKGRFYVKKLIRCAAHRYGVNADRALYIARRESRFRPKAYNDWSCAKGIYQHLCRYWPGRADAYGFDDWSAFNARANIMVTMRMVRRGGWGPWGF
jgi:soluble lytic murein transglycosylase-like protein